MPDVIHSDQWCAVAGRVVNDVGVLPGELVLVRDHAGDPAILNEVILTVEEAGGTPLPEITSSHYVERLLSRTCADRLVDWDAHRAGWVRSADRIIKLAGGRPDLSSVPAGAIAAWHEATARLGQIEDERRIPSVLVELPTTDAAAEFGMRVEDLQALLEPVMHFGGRDA